MYIRRPLCVFCLLFVLVLSVISVITGMDGPHEDRELDGLNLRFKGTIKQIEHKNNNLILHIKDIYFTDGTDLTGNVLMYIPDQDRITEQVHIGANIEAVGEFNDFKRAYNRGQFDLSSYHAIRGDMYAVYKGSILTVTKGYNRIADGLYRFKERTKRVYGYYFDEDDKGVLEALVLADKGDLDRDLKDRYSDAGIGHILALSGLHIATLGFLLVRLLKKLRMPLWTACIISTVVMFLYGLMTGMPVSAIRALIMYFLAIGALLLKRSVDLRTSAALACLIMLIINPDRLYDASFLMSFSAVIGIGLVYPYIRELVLNVTGKSRVRMLKRSDRRLVRLGMGLLSSLLLSVSIQLAILPFTMWFYYKIPLYGILVNLIVIPLAGILLMLAIAAGILGSLVLYVAGPGNLLDPFVSLISYMIHLILKLYDLLTKGVNRIPGAVFVTGRPSVWQMILYYVILAGILVYSAYLMHRSKLARGRIRKNRAAHSSNAGAVLLKYLRIRSLAALIICLSALLILFIRIRPAFEISALYVGQGQCFVIHGRDIPAIMYDCGSTDEKKVGEYTVEPFLECLKLDRVDTVFISHLDTDHVSGLLQLLSDDNSHIKIGRIVVSGDLVQKRSENFKALLSLADKRGVPVCAMTAGDSISWKKLAIECLWPEIEDGCIERTGAAGSASDADLNDGSLVLSLKYRKSGGDIYNDYRILFTGDISCSVEDELTGVIRALGASEGEKDREQRGYDLLQVAHHGSSSAANESFIKAVSPAAAVISAGIDNRYGHPHRETMDILNKNNVPVFVTSEFGETDIRESKGKKTKVFTYSALQ